MTLENDVEIAHLNCPCIIAPWAVTKCRNCAAGHQHHLDDCEWPGHTAIQRVVQMTRLDAFERIKEYTDKEPAISAEVRKALQRAG